MFVQLPIAFYIVLENVGGKKASLYAIGMNRLYMDFLPGVTI